MAKKLKEFDGLKLHAREGFCAMMGCVVETKDLRINSQIMFVKAFKISQSSA